MNCVCSQQLEEMIKDYLRTRGLAEIESNSSEKDHLNEKRMKAAKKKIVDKIAGIICEKELLNGKIDPTTIDLLEEFVKKVQDKKFKDIIDSCLKGLKGK